MPFLWWSHLFPLFGATLMIGLLGMIAAKVLFKEGKLFMASVVVSLAVIIAPWAMAGIKWMEFYNIYSRQELAFSQMKDFRIKRELLMATMIRDLENDSSMKQFIVDVHTANRGNFSAEDAGYVLGRVAYQLRNTGGRMGIKFEETSLHDLAEYQVMREINSNYSVVYNLDLNVTGSRIIIEPTIEIQKTGKDDSGTNSPEPNFWGGAGSRDFRVDLTESGMGGHLQGPAIRMIWDWSNGDIPKLVVTFDKEYIDR